MKKRIAIFTVLCIILNFSVLAFTDEEENFVVNRNIRVISPGLTQSQSIEYYKGFRQEINTFVFQPGNETVIVPAYGNYIRGFSSVGEMIKNYNGDGRIVGGINTDFYITSTGIPLSCLIKDGEIISSCDGRVAMGFDKNNEAIIGYPEIKSQIISKDGNNVLNVAHINKTPAKWGLYLLTDKFHKTTKSPEGTIEIVIRPYDKSMFNDDTEANNAEEDTSDSNTAEVSENNNDDTDSNTEELNTDINSESSIKEKNENDFNNTEYIFINSTLDINKELDVVVTEIRTDSSDRIIPEGCFVACIPGEMSYMADDISIGDEFVIQTTIHDDFSLSENIFGAGSMIVKNGEIVPQGNDSIFRNRNPRTAAGIKEDGSVVFICVDGRRPGCSNGFTITELSEYMIELGCIDAINFDGGGSTTFYSADIGELNADIKNVPSEGRERRVADGLLFINTSQPTDITHAASIYPYRYYLYNKGASLKLNKESVLFADTNYHPTNPIVDFEFSVPEEFGEIINSEFFPNGYTGVADIGIVDKDGEINFEVGKINILDKVDKIYFSSKEEVLSPFETNTELSLSASVHSIPVIITNDSASFVIKIEENNSDSANVLTEVGDDFAYIDINDFTFHPQKKGYKYYITASLGGVEKTIAVEAEKYPFDDMEDHWGYITAYDMYKQGFFIGEISEDKRMFFPERNITKSEFCVVLARILNLSDEYIIEVEEEYVINSEDNVSTEQSVTGEADIADSISTSENSESGINDKFSDETSSEEGLYTDIADEEIKDSNESENVTDRYIPDEIPEWAKGSVYSLYTEGLLDELVSEDETGRLTIQPEIPIKRMDIVRIIGKLLKNIGYSKNDTDVFELPDDFIAENSDDEECLTLIYQSKIMNGYPDKTFRQDSYLTRAEATTVFSRLTQYVKSAV